MAKKKSKTIGSLPLRRSIAKIRMLQSDMASLKSAYQEVCENLSDKSDDNINLKQKVVDLKACIASLKKDLIEAENRGISIDRYNEVLKRMEMAESKLVRDEIANKKIDVESYEKTKKLIETENLLATTQHDFRLQSEVHKGLIEENHTLRNNLENARADYQSMFEQNKRLCDIIAAGKEGNQKLSVRINELMDDNKCLKKENIDLKFRLKNLLGSEDACYQTMEIPGPCKITVCYDDKTKKD